MQSRGRTHQAGIFPTHPMIVADLRAVPGVESARGQISGIHIYANTARLLVPKPRAHRPDQLVRDTQRPPFLDHVDPLQFPIETEAMSLMSRNETHQLVAIDCDKGSSQCQRPLRRVAPAQITADAISPECLGSPFQRPNRSHRRNIRQAGGAQHYHHGSIVSRTAAACYPDDRIHRRGSFRGESGGGAAVPISGVRAWVRRRSRLTLFIAALPR